MTQRSFDIIPDEWHFTREGVIVRALLGMCIILCVIVFLCPDCLLWKLYRQDHGMLCACACAPVCVCVRACRLAQFLILGTAYHFLQSLSSLFPVFLHISAIYRAEKSELQIWMEFIILLFVHQPRDFCAQPPHSIHCCFRLLQCTFMCVWNPDWSCSPGSARTRAVTQQSASNGSEVLVSFPWGGASALLMKLKRLVVSTWFLQEPQPYE